MQVGSILHFLNARFDLLLLSAFASLATVGSYAVAQLVAELVLLFPISLGYVLRAEVASRKRGDSLAGEAMRLNGSLVAICVGLVLVAGPPTIIVGYGPGFHSALVPFLILLPGMWFLSTGGLVQDALSGRGRPGLSSLLAGGEVLITIGLDVLLIPRYGAVGGAIGSVCAYTFYGVASIVTISRLDRVPARTLLFASRTELRAFVATLRSRGLGVRPREAVARGAGRAIGTAPRSCRSSRPSNTRGRSGRGPGLPGVRAPPGRGAPR